MLKLMSPVRRKEKQGYGIFFAFDRCRWNATRANQIVATFVPLWRRASPVTAEARESLSCQQDQLCLTGTWGAGQAQLFGQVWCPVVGERARL